VAERVGVVELPRVVEPVRIQRLVTVGLALDRLRVRVEQQLGRVAAMPVVGIVGAMHPVAVPLAGLDAGEIDVPDRSVDLGDLDPRLGSGVVDQAQLHPVGDLGEDGETHPAPVVGRSQGIWLSRPGLHPILSRAPEV
jgi:hypothetical protein